MKIALPRPCLPARFIRLRRERRGAIALMAALLALPLIGMIGLAVDFAMYSQANSAVTAAARAAVLNAVKVAAAGAAAGSSTYVRDGQNAGNNWFLAQSGKTGLTVSNVSANVTITPGTAITATLTGTAQVPSLFGAVFGVKTYKIAVTTQAQETLAPYVEVIMMLDNSASMGIGATGADIATMMTNSPCDPSMEYTWNTSTSAYSNVVDINYADYKCSYGGGTYDGANAPYNAPACPFSNGSSAYTYLSGAYTYGMSSSNTGMNYTCPGKVNGKTAYPGPPCAFACHSDGSKSAGLGNDLWAMARRNGVTLRLDVLKNAAQQMIADMKTRDPAGAALSLGVYTFDTDATPIYPAPPSSSAGSWASAEAGSNWTTASAAVGWPPVASSTPAYTETGIQPSVASIAVPGTLNGNTYSTKSMTTLAGKLTASGSGATAATPRKALFLITDGIYDEVSGARGAIPASDCDQFKSLGYKVYVLYTTYYPLMHNTYLQTFMPIVEGTGSSSVAYNLQNCSSTTGASDLSTYFIQATDQAGITTALQNFLDSAVTSPARYTK